MLNFRQALGAIGQDLDGHGAVAMIQRNARITWFNVTAICRRQSNLLSLHFTEEFSNK